MEHMNPPNPSKIFAWMKIATETSCCNFCGNSSSEAHSPFCAFDGKTTVVDSEQLRKHLDEWKNGFSDGLSGMRCDNTPRYLLGNKAGKIMRTQKAVAT